MLKPVLGNRFSVGGGRTYTQIAMMPREDTRPAPMVLYARYIQSLTEAKPEYE